MLFSAPRETPILARGLTALRLEQVAAAGRLLEDEVLQTRIVPNDEVYRDKELWIEAIIKEIHA